MGAFMGGWSVLLIVCLGVSVLTAIRVQELGPHAETETGHTDQHVFHQIAKTSDQLRYMLHHQTRQRSVENTGALGIV